MEPKKDAQLTIRLTTESKRELRAAAVRKRRTLNWLVGDIFDRWLTKERKRRPR